MIVAHIMGLPIEESILQLAAGGAGIAATAAVAGDTIRRVRRAVRRRRPTTNG